MVQLPRTIEVIPRRLARDMVDIPVTPWPRLHPPAITAPIPIRILPKKTVSTSLAGGIFHLNSLRPNELSAAPSGTARMKNTPQVPLNNPRKLNSGNGECELFKSIELKNSRRGVVMARPLGTPPNREDISHAAMVSKP